MKISRFRQVGIGFLVVAFLLTSGIWSDPASAKISRAEVTGYRDKKSDVDNRIDTIQDQKGSVVDKLQTTKQQKDYLKKIKDTRSKEYKELEAQKKFIMESELKLEAEINRAQQDFDIKTDLLKNRIRVMYMSSSFSYVYIILQAKGIVDFFYRVELVKDIVDYDKRLLNEAEVAEADLKAKLLKRKEQRLATEKAVKEKEKQISKLDSSEQDLILQITHNQSTLRELERLEDQLEQESKNLAHLILSSQSNDKYYGGTFAWPCPGNHHISSPYGMRIHPIYGYSKMHHGVDIDANSGDIIIAVGDGKVLSSRYESGGGGNQVVIDHGGGVSTVYMHCSVLIAKAGEQVKKGQTIAKVGSTGLSTGPHLHFSVYKNGNTVDPLKGWIG